MNRSHVLFAITLVSLSAKAGPWTKSPGEFYLKAQTTAFVSTEGTNADGEVVLTTEHLSAGVAANAEIGVAPRLHLLAQLPYLVQANRVGLEDRSITAGFGDAVFGLQWTPVKFKMPWAVRYELKVPLYNLGNIPAVERLNLPARGDGQIDHTVFASIGAGSDDVPLYGFFEVGQRFRTESFVGTKVQTVPFSNSLVLQGEAGIKLLWKHILLGGTFQQVTPYTLNSVTRQTTRVGGVIHLRFIGGLAIEANVDWTANARNAANGVWTALGVSYNHVRSAK